LIDQPELAELGQALHRLCLLPGTAERREQDGYQQCDNSDNDEQFHQGETGPGTMVIAHGRDLVFRNDRFPPG
jgi:hypothetical protein